MNMTSYRKSGIALAVATAFALGIAAALTTLTAAEQRGAHPHPNPQRTQGAESDDFPEVDWGYWKEMNPRIIGWVSIPGTGLSQPIVQPPSGDPEFYLAHDVYGMPNHTGCPFLDIRCVGEGGLLDCPNSLVFGHNMGWNDDVFGEIDSYLDPEFARNHSEVLIQTPQRKSRMKVQAVSVVPGWENMERVSFCDGDDFRTWWDEAFAHAAVKLTSSPAHESPLVTLCTCSYSRWQDERTLIYLMSS